MAKMTIEGNEALIENMNVAGGTLPTKFSVKLDVIIDFSGCSVATMANYACGGSSARVKFQATLRKLGTRKLEEMAASDEPVKVHISEVDNEDFLLSEEEKMQRMLDSMTPDQVAFLTAKFQSQVDGTPDETPDENDDQDDES